jgi:hypothetical protein
MDIILVVNGEHTESKVILLEYAIKARSCGHEVLMLDFSEAARNYSTNKIARLREFLLYEDRLKGLIPSICQEFDIEYLKTYFDKQSISLANRPEDFKQVFEALVSSTLAFVSGERNTDYKKLPRQQQKKLYETFASVNDQIKLQIESRKEAIIVTLNGRFLIDGAAVYSAKKNSAGYILLERPGFKMGRYVAFTKSPHSVLEFRALQDAHWNNHGPERNSKALEGLQKKMEAPLDNLASWRTDFTNEIELGSENSTKNVIFFPTTDIEEPSYKHWEDIATFNGDQILAFREFARIAKRYGYKVFVRVHPPGPRGRNITDKEDARWQKIAEEVGAEIFFSRSGVDSYALIRDASLVATYHSSIAIEAILMKKPTLILDETTYSHYIPECCAFSTDSIELYFQNGFQLVPQERLYPWGLFFNSGGEAFEIFDVDDADEIKFRNIKLRKPKKLGKTIKRLRAKAFKNLNCIK